MSERHPPATRENHDTFCEKEHWTLVRGATGRPVRHHRTYELTLWNGHTLRTRISQPIDRSQYGPSMWSHILRNQLEIAADEFWACVKNGELPNRGQRVIPDIKKAVPLYLVAALRDLGVAEPEILTLDAAGAAESYAKLLTKHAE